MSPSLLLVGSVISSLIWTGAARAQEPDEPDPKEAIKQRAIATRLCGPLATPEDQVAFLGLSYHPPTLVAPLNDDCMRLSFPLFVNMTGEVVSAFPVDRDANEIAPGPTFGTIARIGAAFDSGKTWVPTVLHIGYEHDVVTAQFGSDPDLEGDGYTTPVDPTHELRQGFARLSLGTVAHISAGWQLSHWGLGLLANDGAQRWEPGSARFVNPRSGDRVLRAFLATGPHTDANMVFAVGGDLLDGDLLSDDDILLEGDTGRQGVIALMFGEGTDHGGGAYVAIRHQEAADGASTDVVATDLHLRTKYHVDDLIISFEGEGALITGTTELAPRFDVQEHDVLQFGGALRGSIGTDVFGTVIDFLYASGDSNFDDDQQNGFRVDPNYEMGLLLFRYIQTNQTARAAFTAGDPGLVGVPAEDLDRFPTRRSPSNTIAIFPRLRVNPVVGLEVYGGPLFAFTATDIADPLNTRVNGGAPSNALGGPTSRILGTEYDLGARYRLAWAGLQATLGVEGGVFQPGGVFVSQDYEEMDPVAGGRLMAEMQY